ncbi:MAG: hypothetical protein HC919_12565 [Oscillatoriales cyanobacterium SM2_2_1]|nr:hypothetical protein [Oscillatoriales cyanobacterium SM2_2_1]
MVKTKNTEGNDQSTAPKNNKVNYDHWRGLVKIRRINELSTFEHIPAYKLRHEFTNYDELIYLPEVRTLDALERDREVAIIKYVCTSQVLQRRTGILKDKASKLSDTIRTLEADANAFQKIILKLQSLIFSKDKKINDLEQHNKVLTTQNEILQLKIEEHTATNELQTELDRLKKELERANKRKAELAKNNQSLGGRVAHTERYKRQRDEAKAQLQHLQDQVTSLIWEMQQLRQENDRLSQRLLNMEQAE